MAYCIDLFRETGSVPENLKDLLSKRNLKELETGIKSELEG